ncbi:MAG: redoxin domain-containing protein [Planctomycetes bacterium]|nr:redoxin domain-containing protein [Planctomycetota bacterium]
MRRIALACLGLALLATATPAAEPPDWTRYAQLPKLLKRAGDWALDREFTHMLFSMANTASMMGGQGGWWKPGQSRYDWHWLAGRHGTDDEGKISREQFTGSASLFNRLDRDRDGVITAADLDWSSKSEYLKQGQQSNMLFYLLDANSNGRISKEEWVNVFDRLAKDKGYISQDDVRELFRKPTALAKGSKAAKKEGHAGPSMKVLLYGLLTGELGSMNEGPRLNQPAPDFKLPTHDGKQTYTLSQYRGKKPVVLIFGSFT